MKFSDFVSSRLKRLEMKSLARKDTAALEIKQKEVDNELAELRKREAEIEKKLSTIGEKTEKSVKELRQSIENNKEQLSQSKMDTGERGEVEESTEDFMRLRSVVISGLSPPSHLSDFEVARRLPIEVNKILEFLDIPYLPVDTFRMGKHLVKVRFGTRQAQQLLLARAARLRKSETYWKCFIRPSLTESERVERANNYRAAKSEREKRGQEEGKRFSIKPLPCGKKFELITRRPSRSSHSAYRPILSQAAPYYSNLY